VTERLQLGDFQIRSAGEKLQIRHAGTLLAELKEDMLSLHAYHHRGEDHRHAEYSAAGTKFYDGNGKERVRLEVDDDVGTELKKDALSLRATIKWGEICVALSGGKLFDGELAVERDPTPPPPGYGDCKTLNPRVPGLR
jgi:hypothetical protein